MCATMLSSGLRVETFGPAKQRLVGVFGVLGTLRPVLASRWGNPPLVTTRLLERTCKVVSWLIFLAIVSAVLEAGGRA